MYRQGIEVKKDIDVGVIVEKPSWFSFPTLKILT